MISVMSTSNDGGVESPSDREKDAVGEQPTVASTSAGDSSGRLGFDAAGPTEDAALVLLENADRSDETRSMNNTRFLMLENEDSGGENQPSSSVSKMHGNSKNTGTLNCKPDHKKNRSIVEDYDSILSAFDEFAAKGKGETIGHGYKIGDMVWGKVKSHPWWPGHIYNEAFASPSVRRSKHEGHVLVAFFGDSSYGWFDPAELIPFEQNFAEKSRQIVSRAFSKAVEEAIDELSRRRSLGLACRCRNEFNFWPSSVDGYFVVDVGDYVPGVYGLSQISNARDSFRPKEMLSFVQQLALAPMNDQYGTIDLNKNRATVLACRKALFEEFDETYAQAFGTVPVRPPRPTAPVAVDPSKAPLSGRLVIAEALGKGKISVKPTKTKDQVEKDKYLFKRRDEPVQMKSKKASSRKASPSPHPLLVDGSGFSEKVMYSGIGDHMHQTSESGVTDGQHQPTSHQASMVSDAKPSEGTRKLGGGGPKKAKVQKRPAGELSAENAILVEKKKKRKKELSTETGGKLGNLPVADSNRAVAVENVLGMPLDVPLSDNNELDNRKKDAVVGSSLSKSQQEVDFGKVELQMLVTDLCALALNHFHGEERSCPAVIRQVFLKYRSLVYQKSLVLSTPAENGPSEDYSSRFPATTTFENGPSEGYSSRFPATTTFADKINKKIVKPSVRLDDPTKGGKKHGSSDRPEDIKKRKLDVSGDIKKKKLDDSGNTKKKKIADSKLLLAEKSIPQRSTEFQRADVKETAAKNVPPILPKAVKLQSSKRTEHSIRAANPTMLVMKFPAGAALPSGAELRAKFARFGPLDHSYTRIFWKSYTCRLVYQYKADAQAALKFAVGSNNLFGNTNVRCHLKEVGVEAAESEPVKLKKEDGSVGASQSRDSAAVEQRMAQKITAQLLQHPQSIQLKSCLRKPDEGGNGGGRGARVKFVLGGDESMAGEQLLINENKNNNIGSFPEGGSSTHSLDINSKMPKFIPQSSNTTLVPSSSHFQIFPINMMPSSEQGHGPFNAPPTQQMPDIAQQMLNLLMRCSDVVHDLKGVLGYVPYHPL